MRLILAKVPSPVSQPAAGLPHYQIAAIGVALLVSAAFSASETGMLAVIATAVFLLGGLPHGAFDVHLAAKRAKLGRIQLATFIALYVSLFLAMLIGWALAPAVVLPIFLITAVIHFGADWPETNEPVFQLALGFAPICAIGIGHLAEIETIFAAMATPIAALWATRIFVLVAPITLLIAVIALYVISTKGHWQRSLVFGILLISLAFLPALIGFALFFCAFHTPRHLAEIRVAFTHWQLRRAIAVGASMTALALVLGGLFLPTIFAGGLLTAATGFQLLAALAMPHQCMGFLLRNLQKYVPQARHQIACLGQVPRP